MCFKIGNLEISGHAFDRYNERTGFDPQELVQIVSDSEIYVPHKSDNKKRKRLYEKSTARNQYLLTNGDLVIVVKIQGEKHIVTTVMIE